MNRTAAVLVTALLATGISAPLLAQHHDHQAVAGGGTFPDGWSALPDSGGTPDEIKFVTMGKGYHLTLGTSAIVYQKADDGTGPFHAMAEFTQTKASGEHPEGYGLFYGGKKLDGAGQQYTYFLVRGDGQYIIKRRNGKEVSEIKPWTTHAAIKPVDASGKATNAIVISAKQGAKYAVFMVNGQAVDSVATTPDDMKGIVGIRANHSLDLHISGFAVHR